MKILITGAAGGIGSTLGYELYKLGHELVLIDNFRNGYKDNLIIDGIVYGKFYDIDIRQTQKLSLILKKESVDKVIHLAAITALPDCELNKEECISINVQGTTSVLEACRQNGIGDVIFSSTSAIYENNTIEQSPYNEDLNVNPKLFYSLSKKMAEDVCKTYSEHYGMSIQILRFFNVMGPRQDIHRETPPLINYLVKCFINNEAPMLHSNGEQLRDYIYVDDVIDLIKIILDRGCNTNIINVCSGKLISVNDIVRWVKEELSSNIVPTYRDASMLWDSYPKLFEGSNPLKKDVVIKEVNKFCLGTNLKASELGWTPNIDLEFLVKKTAREIKSKY